MKLLERSFIFIALFVLISLGFSKVVFAETLTTPFKSASVVTTDGSPAFTNLGNCSQTDGNTCDRVSSPSYANLYFRDFGDFGIPDGSIVKNVHIRVTGKSAKGLYIGVSSGTKYSDNCQSPSDLWPTFSGTNITTQNFSSPISNGNLSTCLSFSNITSNKFIWRLNYASGQNWSANVDNFEIAFDYELAPTPTPSPTSSPTPTITPTPTPTAPEPFLDLPWDYKNKKFTDEVFRINSYFDHEYPLIFSEPNSYKGTTLPYYGRREPDSQTPYSGHNGYDYDLDNDTPVLAAASGSATYLWDDSGGNTIIINHHNGYFTWYLHMQDKDLITDDQSKSVNVSRGQMIGRVGSTGKFTSGPHLHLSVIEDINNNDRFDWGVDYPFGLTDPYKWRGDGNNGTIKDDPWSLYQSGSYHGSTSYYLWTKPTDSTVTQIPESGGTINQNKLSLSFLTDTISAALNIKIDEQPRSNISDTVKGIDHTFDLNAYDLAGNSVTTFLMPITLSLNYTDKDIFNFIESSLSFFYFDIQQNQWVKMPSVVDTQNKTVTTQTTHFTQFAVMGELKDIQPPTALFEIKGDKGQNNWYRSNVIVSISGEDNPGGSGVKEIFYSLGDDVHWQEYVDSLQLTQEGHYKIYARSIDNAGNSQQTDSIIEFNIDKTPPEATIDANPKILWPPDGKMVNVKITGSANDANLLSKTITVEDSYSLVEPQITDFNQTIQLEAKRNGVDTDGRVYILKVEAEDLAGNKTEKQVQVVVPHDQGKRNNEKET